MNVLCCPFLMKETVGIGHSRSIHKERRPMMMLITSPTSNGRTPKCNISQRKGHDVRKPTNHSTALGAWELWWPCATFNPHTSQCIKRFDKSTRGLSSLAPCNRKARKGHILFACHTDRKTSTSGKTLPKIRLRRVKTPFDPGEHPAKAFKNTKKSFPTESWRFCPSKPVAKTSKNHRRMRGSRHMKLSLQEAVQGESGESVNCHVPHWPPIMEDPKGVKYLGVSGT